MTDLVRINSDNGVGLPVTLADGSRYIIPAMVLVNLAGAPISVGGGANGGVDLDTDGNIVPTYKSHSYTYDTSGNAVTDTVTDGADMWVKTTIYTNGQMTSVSGWVKQ